MLDEFATAGSVSLLLLLVFCNRYLVGAWVRWRVRCWPEPYVRRPDESLPSVLVVTPMFNEGDSIQQTIASLAQQDYPPCKLQILVVDDCSTDESFACANHAAAPYGNVRVVRNAQNLGKRRSINWAVRQATAEFVVSVDSDVTVEVTAIRRLMESFVDPAIGAVGGRVQVRNANVNWLTRMQTIKYYFGYEYLKNIERAFDQVLCLSGCLTAYRRQVLLELEPILERRAVLGLPIKYGEDRYLTRLILYAGYKTRSNLLAKCATTVPTTLAQYFSQQLRWRRSNLIDFFGGIPQGWRLHPVVALHYGALFAMLLAYPMVVILNVLSGQFIELVTLHLAWLAFMGLCYSVDTRADAPAMRVHPLWFLSLGVLMPVTYVLYTPLALFTLDSSSWETRNHNATPPGAPCVRAAQPQAEVA